jgi:hypothetical protein
MLSLAEGGSVCIPASTLDSPGSSLGGIPEDQEPTTGHFPVEITGLVSISQAPSTTKTDNSSPNSISARGEDYTCLPPAPPLSVAVERRITELTKTGLRSSVASTIAAARNSANSHSYSTKINAWSAWCTAQVPTIDPNHPTCPQVYDYLLFMSASCA